MANTQIDGGSAFPYNEMDDYGTHHFSHGGMSLRDWFAGQALIGLYSACKSSELALSNEKDRRADAALFYAIADAMLAERKKDKDND